MDANIKANILAPGVVQMKIEGDVTSGNVTRIKRTFSHFLELNLYQMIINLDELSKIDCSGLAALVQARRQVRKFEGDLLLTGMTPQIREIFKFTGLAPLFQTFDTPEEALYYLLHCSQPLGSVA